MLVPPPLFNWLTHFHRNYKGLSSEGFYFELELKNEHPVWVLFSFSRKTRPFCSFSINIWRTKLCKMEEGFQKWIPGYQWKTCKSWPLPAQWRWAAGRRPMGLSPCGRWKTHFHLLPDQLRHLTALYLFNALKLHWIACSRPINN